MLQEGKKELESLKVEELREILKKAGISYYKNSKRMNKTEMVDRYLEYLDDVGDSQKAIGECIEEEIEIEHASIIEEDEEFAELVDEQEEAERLERKRWYVENAKVGSIVAFQLPSGKVISAAVTRKSSSGRKFMVETKYGAEHKISFDDVLWVRTNKRWPKGIYMLFKKNKKSEVSVDGKEAVG